MRIGCKILFLPGVTNAYSLKLGMQEGGLPQVLGSSGLHGELQAKHDYLIKRTRQL